MKANVTKGCLAKCESLEIDEVCVQVRVKHKCGSCHGYQVVLIKPDEAYLYGVLQSRIDTLTKMVLDRAHRGTYQKDGHVYQAVEISALDAKLIVDLKKDEELELPEPEVKKAEPVKVEEPKPEPIATEPEKVADPVPNTKKAKKV